MTATRDGLRSLPMPLPDGLPDRWIPLAERSIALLREHQDPGGAWPASPRLRALPVQLVPGRFVHRRRRQRRRSARRGRPVPRLVRRRAASARSRPSTGCARCSAAGRAAGRLRLPPGALPLDGTRHEDDWWNFQVDGYGTWLWALERHLARTGGSPAPYADAIDVAVRYLVATGTDTCRDWWEENRDQTHVPTLAGVAAGLTAAGRMGTPRRRDRPRATVADAAST